MRRAQAPTLTLSECLVVHHELITTLQRLMNMHLDRPRRRHLFFERGLEIAVMVMNSFFDRLHALFQVKQRPGFNHLLLIGRRMGVCS